MFESLLIKPQAILFKKETPNYVFSCECCETFKDSVSIENLRWLLLYTAWICFINADTLWMSLCVPFMTNRTYIVGL